MKLVKSRTDEELLGLLFKEEFRESIAEIPLSASCQRNILQMIDEMKEAPASKKRNHNSNHRSAVRQIAVSCMVLLTIGVFVFAQDQVLAIAKSLGVMFQVVDQERDGTITERAVPMVQDITLEVNYLPEGYTLEREEDLGLMLTRYYKKGDVHLEISVSHEGLLGKHFDHVEAVFDEVKVGSIDIKYDDWEYGDYYEWTDSGKDYSLRSFEDHEVNITIIKGIE